MKKIIILSLFSLIISCRNPTLKVSDQEVLKKLEQLTEVQDYFKLQKTFDLNKNNLSDIHSLYFSAIINNVFNKAAESNEAIIKLIDNPAPLFNDTLMNKLYRTKLLNHINLYEYDEAALCSEYILNNYRDLNDSTEIEMLQNEIKIWKALKDVPKQKVFRNSNTSFPMVRDKVGLFNVSVVFKDTTTNFIFDTGANFSVIIRSLTKKLGLKVIEADFYVTAATGKKVKSDIAIAEEISVGGIAFKNVVFLILNDEDLSFPQIDYYPTGAIGFPVIEAMDEIRINRDNQIFVPQEPEKYSFNNFALDGLMPILAAEYKGNTLRFHFDTGATRTSLFPLFFNDFKEEIESNYKKEIFKSGSGGGFVEFDGYLINNITLKIADSKARLDSVRLHIENIGGEENHFHGNFGQDYIKQFYEMIISFKYSSVLFK